MIRLALILIALPAVALAQDFSEGSNARSWNLYAEQPATFEATVTDVLCEITGDCPDDCGAGTRQMGLKRSVDGVLVLAMKNSQAAFSGAAEDLALYCKQVVEVDGLLLDDTELGAINMFLVQTIRPTGSTEWAKANQFTKIWAKKYPEAKGKGPWFRRDPRINEVIAREGYTGLGLDVDEMLIKELFE